MLRFLDFHIAASTLGIEEHRLKQGVLAAALFSAIYLVLNIARRRLAAQLKAVGGRTSDPHLQALLKDMSGHVMGPEIIVVALYAATLHLDLHPAVHRIAAIAVTIFVSYRLLRLAQDTAAFFVRRALSQGHARSESAIRNSVLLSNAALWVAGVLLVLSNLGVNITALLTGLGIGGVAIALAAQASLADIFAAFMIYFDRPFVVGDQIALDNDWKGTVEAVGFKTTRVRAAGGELLVIPNSVLTTNKLRNFSAGHRQDKV